MIKRTIFGTTLFLIVAVVSAQDSFYNRIELGSFQVAYSDTVLLDDNWNYDQFEYNGSAPIFTQIWYPTGDIPSSREPLTFEDFQKINVPQELSLVYDNLKKEQDTSFVKYAFQSYKNGGRDARLPVDFGDHSVFEVYEELKKIKTASHKTSLTQELNFPVIVYHHGAQGLSYENYLMAEYFASRGYVFISSAYHLPLEKGDYGSSQSGFDDKSMPKIILKLARHLSSNSSIFFIGHSMGAQMGFRILYDEENIKGLVSLETTLEFFPEGKYKENWPEVVKAIEPHLDDYELSILMIANTKLRGIETNFPLFNRISSAPMHHVGSMKYFDHGSYTSMYHMRYLVRDIIPQPDSLNSKDQLDYYSTHLKLIEKFIRSVEANTTLERTDFEAEFDFKSFNMNKE